MSPYEACKEDALELPGVTKGPESPAASKTSFLAWKARSGSIPQNLTQLLQSPGDPGLPTYLRLLCEGMRNWRSAWEPIKKDQRQIKDAV